jgi:hypothetical protein
MKKDGGRCGEKKRFCGMKGEDATILTRLLKNLHYVSRSW